MRKKNIKEIMVGQNDYFSGMGDDLVALATALRNASEEKCYHVPLHDSKSVEKEDTNINPTDKEKDNEEN
jgi:hypothetical protein